MDCKIKIKLDPTKIDLSVYKYIDESTILNTKTSKQLTKTKELGRGTNGVVSLFTYKDDNNEITDAVAVKYIQNTDNEAKFVQLLDENKVLCDIVTAKTLYETTDSSVIIYPVFDGDMNSIDTDILKIDEKYKKKLMLSVLQQLICLQKNGLYYLDLKKGNILYKCVGSKDVNLHIADIGGLAIPGFTSLATFPSFRNAYIDANLSTNVEAVWCFLILYISLYDIDYDMSTLFAHDKIRYFYDGKTKYHYMLLLQAIVTARIQDDQVKKVLYNCITNVCGLENEAYTLEKLYEELQDPSKISTPDIVKYLDSNCVPPLNLDLNLKPGTDTRKTMSKLYKYMLFEFNNICGKDCDLYYKSRAFINSIFLTHTMIVMQKNLGYSKITELSNLSMHLMLNNYGISIPSKYRKKKNTILFGTNTNPRYNLQIYTAYDYYINERRDNKELLDMILRLLLDYDITSKFTHSQIYNMAKRNVEENKMHETSIRNVYLQYLFASDTQRDYFSYNNELINYMMFEHKVIEGVEVLPVPISGFAGCTLLYNDFIKVVDARRGIDDESLKLLYKYSGTLSSLEKIKYVEEKYNPKYNKEILDILITYYPLTGANAFSHYLKHTPSNDVAAVLPYICSNDKYIDLVKETVNVKNTDLLGKPIKNHNGLVSLLTDVVGMSENNKNYDIIEYLLQSKADVNKTFDGKLTPLTFAGGYTNGYSSIEVLDLLLKYNADVNNPNLHADNSILELSVYNLGRYTDLNVINRLLEAKADVTHKNSNGQTAIDIAKKSHGYNSELVSVLLNYK
jgi:serine/threonine protein kinase